MENFEREVEKIISHISESETLLALERALILAKSCDETTFGNFVHLKGRYQFFEKNRRDGVLQFSEQSAELATITRSLLSYLSELEDVLKKTKQSPDVSGIEVFPQQKPVLQTKQPGEMNDRLRDLMSFWELPPTQFARRLGVNQSTIALILRDQRLVSVEIVKRLATLYPELNLRWFLTGEGSMFLTLLPVEKYTRRVFS